MTPFLSVNDHLDTAHALGSLQRADRATGFARYHESYYDEKRRH